MSTKLLLLIVCMLAAYSSFSQQFEVPQNVQLQTKEDFVKYEKDVITATNWLEAVPIGTDDGKRKLVSAFILQWITGSPTVTISVNTFATKLADKNPELVILFMASYTRHALQNNYDTSMINGYVAGVKSVVNLYKLGGKVKKDKFVLEAVKASDDGKLEDWIKSHMADTK